jgi:hypothetical protein
MTTIASLLFGSPHEGRAAVERALERALGPLTALRVGGISVPSVEVVDAVSALLELPVGNLALKGWEQQRNVAESLERTRHDPSGREVVELLQHRIRSRQRPTVDVDFDGVRSTVLELDVDVELMVSSAELIIERGRVSSVRNGPTRGHARLSASGVTLAERELTSVDATYGTLD